MSALSASQEQNNQVELRETLILTSTYSNM
jgi:hypothetical protein